MSLSLRIFFSYFLLIGLSTWIVMQNITTELIPAMRQSLEEALVDSAYLMAETVKDEVANNKLQNGKFARDINEFSRRRIEAKTSVHTKQDTNTLIYITNDKGIVLYDSSGKNVGKDYSQWNDVYLTLRGQYGARTTRNAINDPMSSVMYVAAPIIINHRIIGVLSIGKPSASVQPYFEDAVRKIENKILLLLLVSLALVSLIVYWLTLSIRQLTLYAKDVQHGKKVNAPKLREKELAQLAGAMEEMRNSLEGKNYIENYLHSLTHEIKSPLAAIQGAAELLKEDMPESTRQQFVKNISNESQRLHQIVEQLLKLAALEKRQQLDDIELIATDVLINQLCEDKSPILQQKKLTLNIHTLTGTKVAAERFLLQQMISNILDNAIEFSTENNEIVISDSIKDNNWILKVRDFGPGIPDYALSRIFDRFYSLARPATGNKSTGLGLSLVQEVVQLHHGAINIHNCSYDTGGGVEIMIQIPANQK